MKKSFDFPAVLLFSAIFLGVAGCGAGNVQVMERPRVAIEEIDPFAYGDEFAYRAGNVPAAVQGSESPGSKVTEGERETKIAPAAPDTVKTESVPAGSGSAVDRMVYRIQVGIYEERGSADRRADEVRAKLDHPVYVEFEPPFYRVRVGDFTTRKEAEEYVKILQNFGFRGSFWVMKNSGTP